MILYGACTLYFCLFQLQKYKYPSFPEEIKGNKRTKVRVLWNLFIFVGHGCPTALKPHAVRTALVVLQPPMVNFMDSPLRLDKTVVKKFKSPSGLRNKWNLAIFGKDIRKHLRLYLQV